MSKQIIWVNGVAIDYLSKTPITPEEMAKELRIIEKQIELAQDADVQEVFMKLHAKRVEQFKKTLKVG